jgi:hypothetical protein
MGLRLHSFLRGLRIRLRFCRVRGRSREVFWLSRNVIDDGTNSCSQFSFARLACRFVPILSGEIFRGSWACSLVSAIGRGLSELRNVLHSLLQLHLLG